MKYKYFLGIDPGQGGSISVINEEGKLIKVISFRNHIRILWGFKIINSSTIVKELKTLINDFSHIAVLSERVSSYDQGRNSAFNFGANSIGLILVLEALGCGEISSTPPTEWKDLMGVSSKNLTSFKTDKDKKKALKKMSEERAKSLFPYFNFIPSPTADEEESALIAWLCWNSYRSK